MKHPTPNERKRLMDLMQSFDWLFSITNYDRSLSYMEEAEPEKPNTLADVTIDDQYQRISIRIYPHFWTFSPEKQRKALLHEYLHKEVDPLHTAADELFHGRVYTLAQIQVAVETVTSRMENHMDALLRSRKAFAREAYARYCVLPKPKKKKKKVTKRK